MRLLRNPSPGNSMRRRVVQSLAPPSSGRQASLDPSAASPQNTLHPAKQASAMSFKSAALALSLIPALALATPQYGGYGGPATPATTSAPTTASAAAGSTVTVSYFQRVLKGFVSFIFQGHGRRHRRYLLLPIRHHGSSRHSHRLQLPRVSTPCIHSVC